MQHGAVCMDNLSTGVDKSISASGSNYGRSFTMGSADDRKCVLIENWVQEKQCKADHVWYDDGNGNSVQRTMPDWCTTYNGPYASRAPGWQEVAPPEWNCVKGQKGQTYGRELKMNFEQCKGYFRHEEWSFTHNGGNSCYRVKENSATSYSGSWTTCKLT